MRTATFAPAGGSPLPAGLCAFVELDCDDPGCDCRRATIAVLAERERTWVACINLGLDSGEAMAGPFLDPLKPQEPGGSGFSRDAITQAAAASSRLRPLPLGPFIGWRSRPVDRRP
ncbi:hypothetical protein [uncultured Thiodictyon sp.]|uniref:hypothetical protein n=1 Tax=uncultured Thiodictyon sp. TaxID=1846217 RepID=UPI0025EE8A94|nr:hypothetical protein [uncultured Thiodictyon sp.]